MKPLDFAGWITVAYLAGILSAILIFPPSPAPETTSITGTPGGGEILMRAGETPEPFCFLVGQVAANWWKK